MPKLRWFKLLATKRALKPKFEQDPEVEYDVQENKGHPWYGLSFERRTTFGDDARSAEDTSFCLDA